jgi:hypothetical protein
MDAFYISIAALLLLLALLAPVIVRSNPPAKISDFRVIPVVNQH